MRSFLVIASACARCVASSSARSACSCAHRSSTLPCRAQVAAERGRVNAQRTACRQQEWRRQQGKEPRQAATGRAGRSRPPAQLSPPTCSSCRSSGRWLVATTSAWAVAGRAGAGVGMGAGTGGGRARQRRLRAPRGRGRQRALDAHPPPPLHTCMAPAERSSSTAASSATLAGGPSKTCGGAGVRCRRDQGRVCAGLPPRQASPRARAPQLHNANHIIWHHTAV